MNTNDPNQNPYAPPAPAPPPPAEAGLGYVHGEHRQRGGCLTAFLVLMFIANPITALVYIFAGDLVRKGVPNAPDWAPAVLSVLAFTQLGCAIGMWLWKKWGVYGSCALAVVGLVLNLSFGVAPMTAFFGLGGPIILLVLIKPIWRGFR